MHWFKTAFIITTILGAAVHCPGQELLWEQHYGGEENDWGYSVLPATGGGYFVVGWSESDSFDVSGNYGATDLWLVKLNSTGQVEWERNYGGGGIDGGHVILKTSGGSYIIAGSSGSDSFDVSGPNYGGLDFWVLEINDTGKITWEQNYGGGGLDQAFDLQRTPDSNFIVAGVSTAGGGLVSGNYGGIDYWVIEINDTGKLLWEQHYGGGQDDIAWAVQPTDDGGYIVAGETESDSFDVSENHGLTDMWVVKLNDTGKIEWEQNYGGPNHDWAYGILPTPDGGYLTAGRSKSDSIDVSNNYGGYDGWIVKLDKNGNIEWEKNYGGGGLDVFRDIQPTLQGGVYNDRLFWFDR